MIHVRLGEDGRRRWSNRGGAFARGYAFCVNEFLDAVGLAARVGNGVMLTGQWDTVVPSSVPHPRSSKDGAPTRPLLTGQRHTSRDLGEFNGSFCIVRHDAHRLEAAVDRVRSEPLFYGVRGRDFYLSDDASWVRRQVGDDVIDDVAAAEFQMAGYVTGSDTLYSHVKQLQAGEQLLVEDSDDGPVVQTSRYAEFIHLREGAGDAVVSQRFAPVGNRCHMQDDPCHTSGSWCNTQSADDLFPPLDAVLVGTFERLVRSLSGRPVVLPLSGGFDSRLVALMLKRMGYADVTCFSYGVEGNRESKVSRELARELGFRWEFVPYSRERWYEWFHGDEREKYYAFADGLCSIPHLQDWPAVWELKRRGAIADDAVFVPGHTGDFISGGHIPAAIGRGRRFDVDLLVRLIEEKHYVLNGADVVGDDLAREVRRRLRGRFEGMRIETPEQAANAYEWWEWQERQAKFICNAVRAYEFWGYDWRLPLWDAEVMTFWEGVPLRYRMGKCLYNDYVRRLGSDLRVASPNEEGWGVDAVRNIVGALRMTKPMDRLRRSINARSVRRAYAGHFLGWFGVMLEEVFRRNYTGREHLNSFLTRERLGRLAFS